MILSCSSLLTNLQAQGTHTYFGAVIQTHTTITLKLVETLSKLVRSHGKLLSNKMIFLHNNLHNYRFRSLPD